MHRIIGDALEQQQQVSTFGPFWSCSVGGTYTTIVRADQTPTQKVYNLLYHVCILCAAPHHLYVARREEGDPNPLTVRVVLYS